MNKTKFSSFGTFIFRTPLFPIDYIARIEEYLNDPCFNEAIWLSSPEFYQEKMKILLNNRTDIKLNVTINKFFYRSVYRCTPFGLFAGCSVGEIKDSTNFFLVPREKYKRYTRMDMNYMCALIRHLENNLKIRNKLKYFPNDSIYKVGAQLRYVEYSYSKTKRIHQLASIERSEYLERILHISKNGASIEEMAKSLIEPGICLNEAVEFIHQLISEQILVSQLQPKVTGKSLLTELIQNLQEIEEKEILPILKEIDFFLNKIDSGFIGATIKKYETIIELVERIAVPFESMSLFQTDMSKPVINAGLSSDIIKEINDIIEFLNLFSFQFNESNLVRFTEAFYSRYEDQEIPLAQVLDNELGLGYPIGKNESGDINELVDDLIFELEEKQSNKESYISISWLDKIMLTKYINALRSQENVIYLTKEDFKEGNRDLSDLPDTISFMCNILKSKQDEIYFVIKAIGGSSGANLLGRFCHLDEGILKIVKDIAKKEQELNPNAIIAEITHLPESGIGNIVHRPKFRDFELHYLAQSVVEKENQISLDDLMISIKNGRLFLRSRKLNKEIIPRLTNAHNFSVNSLAVYQFLCDLQLQGKRGAIGFQWGDIFSQLEYFPEVRYKNHIISEEKWHIPNHRLKDMYNITDDSTLMESIMKLQKIYKIPNKIVIADSDQELYIDLSIVANIRTMLSLAKGETIIIKKAFEQKDLLITGPEGIFNSEFIFPLLKTKM